MARTRTFATALGGFLLGSAVFGSTVTLPAAASIVGGVPFYSDVRVFNTSYTNDLHVFAVYRCFIGDPCPAVAPTLTIALGPRESAAFDDIVAGAFGAPDTAGGIQFDFDADVRQFVVTSRLYSTAPEPTVGMFIPGLETSAAHARTVLTSIRNGGAGEGFRTNVGVFNPFDLPGTVAFRIHDGFGAPQGVTVTQPVGARSGLQVSGIFAAAGVPDFQTENAVITVEATTPVFSYAAVIDNATSDPIFVIGSADAPPGTPTITHTPTITFTPSVTFTPSNTFTPSLTFTASRTPSITATSTPTQTFTITQTPTASASPTITRSPVTRTPTVNPNRIVIVAPNGLNAFFDTVTLSSNSTIFVGTTIQWNWEVGSGLHSTTSGNCSGGLCSPDGVWSSPNRQAPYSYTHTFNTVGTFGYYCMIHGTMMQGAVNVLPF